MEHWKIAFMRRFYFSDNQNERYTDEDVIKHINNYTASAITSTFSSDRAYCFKAGWEAFRDTLSSFIEKRID